MVTRCAMIWPRRKRELEARQAAEQQKRDQATARAARDDGGADAQMDRGAHD